MSDNVQLRKSAAPVSMTRKKTSKARQRESSASTQGTLRLSQSPFTSDPSTNISLAHNNPNLGPHERPIRSLGQLRLNAQNIPTPKLSGDNLSSVPGTRSSATPNENPLRAMAASALNATLSQQPNPFNSSRIPDNAFGENYNKTIDDIIHSPEPVYDYILCIDLGTTFGSVSFFRYRAGEYSKIHKDDVLLIKNWPLDNTGERCQFPMEIWYPSVKRSPDTEDESDESMQPQAKKARTRNVGAERIAKTSKENWSSAPFNGPPPMVSKSQRDSDQSPNCLWGYQVPYQRFRENSDRDQRRLIGLAKLHLISDQHNLHDLSNLQRNLKHLIRIGVIRERGGKQNVQDPVADLLTFICQHAKNELVTSHGFTKDSSVQWVLPIPTIFEPSATRVWQSALATAIRRTSLGSLSYGCVDNLFTPTEPECAAKYLIDDETDDLILGDTFAVLDSGGGTTDFTAYTIDSTFGARLRPAGELQNKPSQGKQSRGKRRKRPKPPQVKPPQKPPRGIACAGGDVNDAFESDIKWRLRNEFYLGGQDRIQEIANFLRFDFEENEKRNNDVTRLPSGSGRIEGLRPCEAKRFGKNRIHFDPIDYEKWFLPTLKSIWRFLEDNLKYLLNQNERVRKVYLVGGFGSSPSLKSFLRDKLRKFNIDMNLKEPIELVEPIAKSSISSIVAGGPLLAMERTNATPREALSSYGFLVRMEVADNYPLGPDVEINDVDGKKYVKVIRYFMSKGQIINSKHEFKTITLYHTFDASEKEFLCEECWRQEGVITTNMSRYVNEGEIELTYPQADENGDILGRPRFHIEFDLVPMSHERNLTYQLRYKGKVIQTGQVSIAAAFKPGTH
ncbi:hypothetical protein G7Y89_g1567 [Cudoniella acicularis]|uniref:Uncharacterized protein n=1 Tax=Cudoniella acicularis TaxID=354080 RepID=A0A8H4RWT4_9HELO|nr:hypothetical protein G7Y89_g1567 [Cudoniella acicularis]